MSANGKKRPRSAFAEHGLAAVSEHLVAEIRDLYCSDDVPWVVGYSGGKDSTATLQLVWLALASLAPEQRKKPVHVISTDTLVENPVVAAWVTRSLVTMEAGAKKGRPADQAASPDPRGCRHVLGEPDRTWLSRTAPQVPMVHRAAQDQAIEHVHQQRRP